MCILSRLRGLALVLPTRPHPPLTSPFVSGSWNHHQACRCCRAGAPACSLCPIISSKCPHGGSLSLLHASHGLDVPALVRPSFAAAPHCPATLLAGFRVFCYHLLGERMLKEIPVTRVKADGSQRFTDRRASQQVTWTPGVAGGAPAPRPAGQGRDLSHSVKHTQNCLVAGAGNPDEPTDLQCHLE